MRLIRRILLWRLIMCALLLAQVDGKAKFEVASVRPNVQRLGGGIKGGPGSSDPGRISYKAFSLKTLIQIAYSVHPIRIKAPSWMADEYFDIVAKVPAGATVQDEPFMLKELLEERFHLKVHNESHEMQAYALTVGKSGPTLKAYPMQLPPDSSSSIKFQGVDKDGFPFAAPGHTFGIRMPKDGQTAIILARQPVSSFCDSLTGTLQTPVVDQTGLAGRYDFRLIFANDASGAPSDPDRNQNLDAGVPGVPSLAPTLFRALESQLGLKLERKRVPVEFLVVDAADKQPVEN